MFSLLRPWMYSWIPWIWSLFPSFFSKVKEDLQCTKAVISEPTNTWQEMIVVSLGNDKHSPKPLPYIQSDSGSALFPLNLLLLAVGKCAFLAWWPFAGCFLSRQVSSWLVDCCHCSLNFHPCSPTPVWRFPCSTRQCLIGERGHKCSRGLDKMQLQLCVSAAPCVAVPLW